MVEENKVCVTHFVCPFLSITYLIGLLFYFLESILDFIFLKEKKMDPLLRWQIWPRLKEIVFSDKIVMYL